MKDMRVTHNAGNPRSPVSLGVYRTVSQPVMETVERVMRLAPVARVLFDFKHRESTEI